MKSRPPRKYCLPLLLLLIMGGCEQSQAVSPEEAEARRYEWARKDLISVISNIEATADEQRQLYDVDKRLTAFRHALELVENRLLSDKPLLLSAMLEQDAQELFLFLNILDRDGNAFGIIVAEHDTHTGQSLTEKYPVFAGAPCSSIRAIYFFMVTDVSLRRDASNRKNTVAWAAFLADPHKANPPPVVVSPPREGLVVQMAAYDSKGNIGPFTTLQHVKHSGTD